MWLAAILAALALPVAAQEAELFIAGTLPSSGDYGDVLQALGDVQADGTTLSLYWDELSPGGAYAAEPDWPAIANAVYPDQGLSIALVFPVIDTLHDRRPTHLAGLPYDDPAVIAGFVEFAGEVLARMPDVTIRSIAIGNEVDGLLTPATQAAYERFFVAAKAEVAALAPGIPIGVTQTWGGLEASTEARRLAMLGDVVMINWYPLEDDFSVAPPESVQAGIAAMPTLFLNHAIHLTEVGAPSAGCGATESSQRDFVAHVTEAASAPASPLEVVTWVWLHDLAPGAAETYGGYYNLAGNDCFTRYLASLGLRSWDGADKAAFGFLREVAR